MSNCCGARKGGHRCCPDMDLHDFLFYALTVIGTIAIIALATSGISYFLE